MQIHVVTKTSHSLWKQFTSWLAMVWFQLCLLTITLVCLIVISHCRKLLDSFGAKFYTLPGCGVDWAMPASQIDQTFPAETIFDCARICKSKFEECGWFNYKDDTKTNNCDIGKTPKEARCKNLEKKNGTIFYLKERFCMNNSSYSQKENRCKPCPPAYTGQRCNFRAYDCSDYYYAYLYKYEPKDRQKYIWPEKSAKPFQVRCYLSAHQGVTTVMSQGRTKEKDNFSMNQTWAKYRDGFGIRNKDFYIGNRYIHEMISGSRAYWLWVVLRGYQNSSYYVDVHYDNFRIGNESEKYRISMSPWRKNKQRWYGDALFPGNKAKENNDTFFSTYDKDNDGNATFNCAQNYGGGWWFNTGCSEANINGKRILDFSTWSPDVWPQLSWGKVTDIVGFKSSEMSLYPKIKKAPNYLLVV